MSFSIEGPCIYKFNDDDKENIKYLASLKGITLDQDNEGKDLYGLIADNNGNYIFPGVSDDITTGKFNRLGEAQSLTIEGTSIYSMPKPTASHGTIMPITSEEYNNLRLAYDEDYRAAAEPYITQAENAATLLTLPTAASADLTLPATADNGAKITWESSIPSVIATDGKVSRPTYNQGDIAVTLTATISAGPNDGTVRDQIKTRSASQLTIKILLS